MRITYRTLGKLINKMSEEQLDSDVTVEDSWDEECYPAELRICGPNHASLDDNHPVIYINHNSVDDIRRDDIGQIAFKIGLTE